MIRIWALLILVTKMPNRITDKINNGDLSEKPGWIRWSLHPTTTDEEIDFFIDSLNSVISNIAVSQRDYVYLKHSNEFMHKSHVESPPEFFKQWFSL